MFKVTVVNATDERKEPDIYAQKTGVRFEIGTTWLTDVRYTPRPVEYWVKTPSGNWTAELYPINNDPSNLKRYLDVVEIPVEPEPTGQYDPKDKLIHEVNGVVVGEYHRWIG